MKRVGSLLQRPPASWLPTLLVLSNSIPLLYPRQFAIKPAWASEVLTSPYRPSSTHSSGASWSSVLQGHLAQSPGHFCKALGSTSKQGAPGSKSPQARLQARGGGSPGRPLPGYRQRQAPGGGAEPVLNKMRTMRSPSRAAAGSWSPQVSLPLAHVAAHGAPAASRQ